jgi:hypothetical protein
VKDENFIDFDADSITWVEKSRAGIPLVILNHESGAMLNKHLKWISALTIADAVRFYKK